MGKERGPLRVPVQRKIMLHIWDHMSSEEDYEVPEEVTQRGIGRGLSLRQTHVSRALSELCNEGLVRCRTAHIKGEGRRKKVYFLTKKGAEDIKRFTDEVESVKLPVRMRSGSLKLLPLSKIFKMISREEGRDLTLGQLLNDHYDGSEVSLVHEKYQFVSQSRIPINDRFFGREKELVRISSYVNDKTVRFVSIISMAGQGKTSLMAEFASGVEDRNLHWITVDEWTRPLGIIEDIALRLEAVGHSTVMEHMRGGKEPGIEESVTLLLKDLKGTDLVIVLDDIHKNRPVMELLSMVKTRMPRGGGTTFLTGSREKPSFYRTRDLLESGIVREMELIGLDQKSASKLLDQRGVPTEEHELAYRITSGHPLALQLYVVGSDIDGYLWEEITGSLKEEEMELLNLASIYKQPVPLEALFPGRTPDRDLVDGMVDRILLRRFHDGKIGIHDLLSEHFRERMTPEGSRKYLDMALRFLSSRGSEKDILHKITLLSEYEHIDLTETLLREGDQLVSKGYSEVLDLVPRIDPFALEGTELVRYLLLFADLNERDGELGSAEVKVKRALEECDSVLSKGSQDKEEVLDLVSKLLFRLGEISRKKGGPSSTIEAHRKNVAYNRKYGNRAGLGKALNNLALAYMDRGEIDKALEDLKEALKVLEESGDPGLKAFVEASIADVYIMKRDHRRAIKHLKGASSFRPRLPSINAKLKRRTGLCWASLGDHEEALRDLKESYASFLESNDSEAALWVLLDLHTLSMGMNDRKAALEYLERASRGVNDLKGSSEKRAELLLQCRKLKFDLLSAQRSKKLDRAAKELAEALIETMEPKRSVLYLDDLIREIRDFDHITLVLKDFEELSWSKGDRNGSLVVSLRRASLLQEMGRKDEAEKLLRSIIRKGRKIGFGKAVRKAGSLLS